MYKNFNTFILPYSEDNEPGDYWYDCGVIESTKILSAFTDFDWEYLLKNLSDKSIYWKIRLVECLGDLHNSYELRVILELIDTDDDKLFVSCVDSLRSINLCHLPENILNTIQTRIINLMQNASLPVKRVLEDFMHKF